MLTTNETPEPTRADQTDPYLKLGLTDLGSADFKSFRLLIGHFDEQNFYELRDSEIPDSMAKVATGFIQKGRNGENFYEVQILLWRWTEAGGRFGCRVTQTHSSPENSKDIIFSHEFEALSLDAIRILLERDLATCRDNRFEGKTSQPEGLIQKIRRFLANAFAN